MAEIIARVGKVAGEAFARDSEGKLRRLKSGDPIREGEVVQAGAGGEVQLKLADGRDLVVRSNEAAKLDAEVGSPEVPNAGDSALQNNPAGFAKISKAIVGQDGTFSFEDDGGRGQIASAQKEGHTFVELLRIVESVSPLGFQFETSRSPLGDIVWGFDLRPKVPEQAISAAEFDLSEAGFYSVASERATMTITVNPVNDAPVAVDDNITATEDTLFTSTVSLIANDTDVDGPSKTAVAGTYTTTQGGTLVLAADGSYTYTPALNFTGTDTVGYTVTDGTLTDVGTLTITVNPVNDAPINTVPAAQTSNEDTTKAITGLSISDVDAGSGSMTVTLGVTNGTLTVSGGSATIGGSGTSTVTLTGTAVQINATLAATVNYVPTANYNGTATLTMTTSDNGNTGSGGPLSDVDTVTINITAVNDAPTLTATAVNPTFAEGAGSTQAGAVSVFSGAAVGTVETGQTITGLSFTVGGLLDGANERIVVDGTTITLGANTSGTTATNGMSYTVTIAGGTATVVLSSVAGVSTANINSLVNGITYQNTSIDNPTDGNRVFTLTQVVDSGGTANGGVNTTTLSIASTVDVNPADDAPINTVPAAQTTNEDTTKAITGLSISDVDAGSGSMTVTLGVTNGTLTVSGGSATIGGSGTSTVTLTGTAVQINATLAATVNYVPTANYNGTATLTMTTSDNGNTGSGGPLSDVDTVTLTVNPGIDLSARWIDYWQFNEGTGSTSTNFNPAVDQVGSITDNNKLNPAADLRPTWTTGRNDSTALQFNGVGGASGTRDGGWLALDASVTNPLAGQGATQATLSFWIKTTQVGQTDNWDSPSVIGMENNGGTSDIQWGWINASGKIGLGMLDSTGVMSTTSINDGVWHQVVITHNFTSGATQVFVDGVREANQTYNAGVVTPNQFLGLGVTADDGATSHRFLNATLEDVRIYSTALTTNQAQAIYETELMGNQDNVIANDGQTIHLALTANDAASMVLSGLPSGTVVSDGVHAAITVTATGTADISGWNATDVALSSYGTGSFLMSVTGTDASGNKASEFLSVVNNSDMFTGTSVANTLTGNANSNVLSGGDGNDTLSGANGNDMLIGGKGDDSMTGGSGADVFVWALNDKGTAATPAKDTLVGFDTTADSDKLDLRDLLVGELHTGSDSGNLANYLHFNISAGTTTIEVKSTGSGGFNQSIQLTSVDLSSGVVPTGGQTLDQAIIQDLLTKGKLIVD